MGSSTKRHSLKEFDTDSTDVSVDEEIYFRVRGELLRQIEDSRKIAGAWNYLQYFAKIVLTAASFLALLFTGLPILSSITRVLPELSIIREVLPIVLVAISGVATRLLAAWATSYDTSVEHSVIGIREQEAELYKRIKGNLNVLLNRAL
jgi:hypothetical protein